MASIGHGGYYHPSHGKSGVKIYNDVNVATPYPGHHHGYHHGNPYHHRPLPLSQGIRQGLHPTHRAAVGGADPLNPQHGLFGNIWKWTKNHKEDIIKVATNVAGQVLGPQHGLSVNPDAHKDDAKVLEIAEKLEHIDKHEREKEAELTGLMRRKHVLASAIQARVMNNHLEQLASEAASGDKPGDDA